MGNSTSSSPPPALRKDSAPAGAARRRPSRSVRVPPTTRLPKTSVQPTRSQEPGGAAGLHALDMPKSQSMHELRHRHSAHGLGPAQGSVQQLLAPQNTGPEGAENDASAMLLSSRFANTSVYPSMCRQKSFRRSDPAHPLGPAAREIVRTCFENPHLDLGNRICSRVFERRPDFQKFIYALGKDKWPLLTNNLQNYLEEVVLNVDSLEEVQRLSRRYGEEHVPLKAFGFKPDLWVALADATTVECVILDMASHQPTDTVAAWSQLASLMFSAIRDGYYNALRAQRMSTRRSLRRQESAASSAAEAPPAAGSAAAPADSQTPSPVPSPQAAAAPPAPAGLYHTPLMMIEAPPGRRKDSRVLDRPLFE